MLGFVKSGNTLATVLSELAEKNKTTLKRGVSRRKRTERRMKPSMNLDSIKTPRETDTQHNVLLKTIFVHGVIINITLYTFGATNRKMDDGLCTRSILGSLAVIVYHTYVNRVRSYRRLPAAAAPSRGKIVGDRKTVRLGDNAIINKAER